ncbi:pimeloyl-ACP methyl ester carboxylesterase [Microbacterium sp. SLBN-154]|uniref:alpha/beta hydrolase n=1 Tax=Microbacterium sp. SLBN-154 TaxID=2768458 RepID=UPI001154DAA5|nr:alpha/beta hydrolase [Microbacterium sp. SLBN-154]TQK20784.1 pimeloyl-ACP methyl ester carboxylesterase [Microbacterium sp. SLBN-154]
MAARHGERIETVRRPDTSDAPAFDLTYVRSGPRGATPVVILPGGPGLASVRPYRSVRRIAAGGGLDVVMVEHRGVGLSRTDLAGAALPPSAMRILAVLDDVAAVLDHERIERAVLVGSSYGSYLASAFGVRHPDRVERMLLDSPLQSTADLAIERERVRGLFWDAGDALSADVRTLVDRGEDERSVLDVVRAAYELAGLELAAALARRRVRRGPPLTWRALSAYATRDEDIARIPGVYEFDLAGVIAFRELAYGAPLDGLPLDPASTYAPLAPRFPAFAGEPYDLPALTPAFPWPLVVLSGTRDLRTPPAIAERTARRARDAVLVTLENGHSALDTHPVALLNAVRRLVRGMQHRLPDESGVLERLPRRGAGARLPALLEAMSRAEGLLGR